MIAIMVTGSRHFDSPYMLAEELETIRAGLKSDEIMLVIHGNAKGADHLAQVWVDKQREKGDLKVVAGTWPAAWSYQQGLGAGYARNLEAAHQLKFYADQGVPWRILVCHYMHNLDQVLGLNKSGTAHAVRALMQMGFSATDMTYIYAG